MDNEELKMLTFLYFDSYTHNRKSKIDEGIESIINHLYPIAEYWRDNIAMKSWLYEDKMTKLIYEVDKFKINEVSSLSILTGLTKWVPITQRSLILSHLEKIISNLILENDNQKYQTFIHFINLILNK